jgi:hypothetical protein
VEKRLISQHDALISEGCRDASGVRRTRDSVIDESAAYALDQCRGHGRAPGAKESRISRATRRPAERGAR